MPPILLSAASMDPLELVVPAKVHIYPTVNVKYLLCGYYLKVGCGTQRCSCVTVGCDLIFTTNNCH